PSAGSSARPLSVASRLPTTLRARHPIGAPRPRSPGSGAEAPVRHLGRARELLARRRSPPEPPDLRSLMQRVDALEAMVEGLQDSVDRQARRQDERINELAR